MLLSDTQQQQDARKPGAVRRPPAAPPDTRVTHVLCGHGQQAAALGGGGDGSAVSVSLGEKYAEDIRFVCMILSIRKDSVAHLHQPSLVLLQQMLTPTVRNQRN
ncbi:Os04g0657200 [Oryza sativa Japonica Group]|uniref:Os04g0657200 protein n=1 Tax=Oryza sativa subsp. japonica TaxID=39947 RepID=A0A0P0WFS3_ORYSJ|nr:Os04g0657200 [Oryza sativa Japonica Group]